MAAMSIPIAEPGGGGMWPASGTIPNVGLSV